MSQSCIQAQHGPPSTVGPPTSSLPLRAQRPLTKEGSTLPLCSHSPPLPDAPRAVASGAGRLTPVPERGQEAPTGLSKHLRAPRCISLYFICFWCPDHWLVHSALSQPGPSQQASTSPSSEVWKSKSKTRIDLEFGERFLPGLQTAACSLCPLGQRAVGQAQQELRGIEKALRALIPS